MNSLLSISSCSIQALSFLWASRIFTFAASFWSSSLSSSFSCEYSHQQGLSCILERKMCNNFKEMLQGHTNLIHVHSVTTWHGNANLDVNWWARRAQINHLLYYFVEPQERFSWFVNDEVIWKYRHCFVWIKIWLLEKGGYSRTQKNNNIFYLIAKQYQGEAEPHCHIV